MLPKLLCSFPNTGYAAMLCFGLLPVPLAILAQAPNTIPADVAIDMALEKSSLTQNGTPFHAVVEITPEKDPKLPYRGKVEIFWQSKDRYRVRVESPSFSQTLIVNDSAVEEDNVGDFYPTWLHSLATVLLDPLPEAPLLRGSRSAVALGEHMRSCVNRDDRPGGITGQMTWSGVCFTGVEPHIVDAHSFTRFVGFEDYKPFVKKDIARRYSVSTANYDSIIGTVTTLEELKHPDASLFVVAHETPAAQRIQTRLVSTTTEESMLEHAPKIEWPPVREGKLDGYMIVYAVTDRTGQVRETAKHNSDTPGLEAFGREQALLYKFKPLVVDGVSQQMAMPLVLHFATTRGEPIPELDDKQSRKLMSGCSVPHEIQDPASAGQQVILQIQVSEDGHIMTLGVSDRKIPPPVLYGQFRGCHFDPYKQNGHTTAYHLNLTLTAR